MIHNTLTIGIDGNEANVERRVGISEYSFELLEKFKEYQISNIKYQIYLKNDPLPHMPEVSENWQYIVFGPKKLWTQFALPLRLLTEKNKPDVFFSPSHYAPRFSIIPSVISVMDVSYLRFPELFAKKDLYQLQNWTAYSAKQAKKIFTISQSSKNDIINYYHISPENVVVTYPGIREISNIKYPLRQSISEASQILNMEELQKKYGISKNYVLFVGTIQPRKNIARLIEAFKHVLQSPDIPSDLQLVIVGKKGWLFEPILAKPKELGIEDKVLFLDFISNEELPVLYKHARCYCLPSLYEGFGLPVLEAMQYDCPVITSNISSLPEAGGNAALYVDPESTESITNAITRVITDKKLRGDLIEKGKKQVKKFSWDQTAQATLKVLQEVGSS